MPCARRVFGEIRRRVAPAHLGHTTGVCWKIDPVYSGWNRLSCFFVALIFVDYFLE